MNPPPPPQHQQEQEPTGRRHPIEAEASWSRHQTQRVAGDSSFSPRHRRLHDHHHHHDPHYDHDPDEKTATQVEADKEEQFWNDYRRDHANDEEKRHHQRKKHRKRIQALLKNTNNINGKTVHGLMIDAGSTGSRLHIYEWEPRVLRDESDIAEAVSGEKLSYPGTESRWTDRLRPGLASFGSLTNDDDLRNAVAEYLQPLLDFAQTALQAKADHWGKYPIFLRATAGMRSLDTANRARVIHAVRTLFHNATYSPFAFVDEQARVLSGEEEAVYDWVGVNFLLGKLLQQSEGTGTAVHNQNSDDPSSSLFVTHGALDMGGASTQISFYEPNQDIMANLFKLQIGQSKHWNIYAHSFLFYGINEAMDRYNARLTVNKTLEERLIQGIYNPCLPHGGSKQDLRTNIHISPSSGVETWTYQEGLYPSGDGYFQAVLINDQAQADVDECFAQVQGLLHLDKNEWCDFAHRGDCSFAGIYQPTLPRNSNNNSRYGDFVAFSNYYRVWQFLNLAERATLTQLEAATRYACALTHDELVTMNRANGNPVDVNDLTSYCLRSAYTFQLLHNGYGFQMNDTIRAIQLIDGQKVGWALGAMLYEINAMPWHYEKKSNPDRKFLDSYYTDHDHAKHDNFLGTWQAALLVITVFGMIATLALVLVRRERKLRKMYGYEMVKDVHTLSTV